MFFDWMSPALKRQVKALFLLFPLRSTFFILWPYHFWRMKLKHMVRAGNKFLHIFQKFLGLASPKAQLISFPIEERWLSESDHMDAIYERIEYCVEPSRKGLHNQSTVCGRK